MTAQGPHQGAPSVEADAIKAVELAFAPQHRDVAAMVLQMQPAPFCELFRSYHSLHAISIPPWTFCWLSQLATLTGQGHAARWMNKDKTEKEIIHGNPVRKAGRDMLFNEVDPPSCWQEQAPAVPSALPPAYSIQPRPFHRALAAVKQLHWHPSKQVKVSLSGSDLHTTPAWSKIFNYKKHGCLVWVGISLFASQVKKQPSWQ